MILKTIEVEVLKVRATKGADIGSCLWEATELAIKERRTVALNHNDGKWLIDPKAILRYVDDYSEEIRNKEE